MASIRDLCAVAVVRKDQRWKHLSWVCLVAAFGNHQQGIRRRHRREQPGSLRPGEMRYDPVIRILQTNAHEVLELSGSPGSLGESDHQGPAEGVQESAQLPKRRAREEFERDERAHRIAGETNPWHAVPRSKPYRRTWPGPQPPEVFGVSRFIQDAT